MSDFEQDVDDFDKALVQYKQRHGRMFPTCSEILEVARDIGFYRQPELAASMPVEEEGQDESGETTADDESVLV